MFEENSLLQLCIYRICELHFRFTLSAKMVDDKQNYPTYFVVCLHTPCNQEAANFIVESLRKAQDQGGAGLIIRQERMPASKTGLVLHVSASKKRLFELAEAIDLKKPDIR